MPYTKSKLSIVIAFRNEGVFLEETIKSIRSTSYHLLDIILVDDNSDDGIDYLDVAKRHGCKYYRSDIRIGSAGGKQVGAMLVDTPYFMFFDSHMKLFHRNWDVMVCSLLDKYPNSIICARTITMHDIDGKMVLRDEQTTYEGECYGCYVNGFPSYEFDAKWINTMKTEPNEDGLVVTPCIFGAVYGFSRKWWDFLHGFRGLAIYGMEEPFISMKCWLAGGDCYITTKWGVGHVYRKERPKHLEVSPRWVDCNRFLLSEFFLGIDSDDMKHLMNNLNIRIGDDRYNETLSRYNEYREAMVEEWVYFSKNCMVREISDFCRFNNMYIDDENDKFIIDGKKNGKVSQIERK